MPNTKSLSSTVHTGQWRPMSNVCGTDTVTDRTKAIKGIPFRGRGDKKFSDVSLQPGSTAELKCEHDLTGWSSSWMCISTTYMYMYFRIRKFIAIFMWKLLPTRQTDTQSSFYTTVPQNEEEIRVYTYQVVLFAVYFAVDVVERFPA